MAKCQYWSEKIEYQGCIHFSKKNCDRKTNKDCDIIPRKPKRVFLWKFLDSKKGDRLAEVIREALEKNGVVTVTVE